MDIYLPVAELSVNLFMILGLGGAIGFVSGVFGVGGGFLMTPLLIFIGIPPAVAVGSVSAQVLASSVSGVLAHMRRQTVDLKMGLLLTVGGSIGSAAGVFIFGWLQTLGQVDIFISICYVVFLGTIGGLMFIESLNTLIRSKRKSGGSRRKLHQHHWMHGLPLKMRFQRSRLYISIIMPSVVGLLVGLLGAVMGVGGGFIMVPAMIYIIGMPTNIVVGTSLFQIALVTMITTYLHAYNNYAVDIVLALLLIAGAVVGAQFGSRVGALLRGEHLRILLALMVLAVCVKLAYDLIASPADPYSIAVIAH
ncbi:MAG: sulfite exporter TauE/SafE family protein [Geminicoccaceae bacterium]|nr:sulfite exporter TauE/SafE family protein [Geminicoccaceae bacterium]MCB9942403.1 sulfite exporter TauE/SafE family protein [Geminicoccaceae bacterium]